MSSQLELIIGLDLSIRRSAVVSVPVDFVQEDGTLRWNAVTYATSRGESLPRETLEVWRVQRNVETARFIQTFVQATNQIAHVFVEDYAYGAAYESARLGEVTGLVKARLYEVEPKLTPTPVNMASARKVLLGKLSRGTKPKEAVERALRRLSCPFDTMDEMDAFVVANYGLSSLGHKSVMLQPADWGGA